MDCVGPEFKYCYPYTSCPTHMSQAREWKSLPPPDTPFSLELLRWSPSKGSSERKGRVSFARLYKVIPKKAVWRQEDLELENNVWSFLKGNVIHPLAVFVFLRTNSKSVVTYNYQLYLQMYVCPRTDSIILTRWGYSSSYLIKMCSIALYPAT